MEKNKIRENCDEECHLFRHSQCVTKRLDNKCDREYKPKNQYDGAGKRDQKEESEVCYPNYHIMLDDFKEPDQPNLTDLLELMNALDELCTKYRISWDYLQQLTQLIDDYFTETEIWNYPPMVLTADQISAKNIRG